MDLVCAFVCRKFCPHPVCLSVLAKSCDWSKRFIGVIFPVLSLVGIENSQITRRFVQSKSPADLSVYKCTWSGINSCVFVPSKVCAPEVSTKLCWITNAMLEEVKKKGRLRLSNALLSHIGFSRVSHLYICQKKPMKRARQNMRS